MCLVSSKRHDSSTIRLNSSQRQLQVCSAVVSHLFVLAPVLVPLDDVAGLVSTENARFM